MDAAPGISETTKKGLWVTAIGEVDVLSSVNSIRELISFAKKGKFNLIFIQVYRGDRSWFHSDVSDSQPYRHNHSVSQVDGLEVLIRRAHKEGIQIHAWINTLSLSQNKQAPILQKDGNRILTKDQHGQTALREKPPARSGSALGGKGKQDGHYGTEDQLFLEPGDPHVQRHLIDVVEELAERYPELDGIHFDYIRYPAAPPYIPGSRFNSVGLSYGYGEENVRRFQEATGLDPHHLEADVSLQWDQWKRDQVTHLLRQAAAHARKIHPAIQISCAVLSAFDRAYLAAGQDWAAWIGEGLVDFVVLMNYSTDSNYVRWMTLSAIGMAGDSSKILVGLGAHLMSDSPELLVEQVKRVRGLHPGGIVLFDYQVLSKSPLKELLDDPDRLN